MEKFQVYPKARCPCGSGKEYRKCHSPNRDQSDQNLWRGPGFPQTVHLGYEEPFTGFRFENEQKGEIVLLKNYDRIPIGRYFTIEQSILSYSAIVRSLTISQNNGTLIYSGSIEIKGDATKSVPILVGTLDVDSVDSFEANISGKPVSFEKGSWFGFIGEDGNPIARTRKRPQWFRFFKTQGFLVEFEPVGELYFKLSTRSKSYNLFTLSLPFQNIELSCPKIITKSTISTCFIEIERENVSWDLVLHSDQFNEMKRDRKDSKVIRSHQENEKTKFNNFKEGIRKPMSGPRKIRINLLLPSESPKIGKFSKILENWVRNFAENPGLIFWNKGREIHEANFRDDLLKVIKSNDYFAVAEPSRRVGFVDILVKYEDLEAIIEFKVWKRPKYKEVIKQVLGYGTAWTTEYATVMINPNQKPIVDKFISNAKSSPGFIDFTYVDTEYRPIQKLVSYHYISTWDKYFTVVHFIINLRFLR